MLNNVAGPGRYGSRFRICIASWVDKFRTGSGLDPVSPTESAVNRYAATKFSKYCLAVLLSALTIASPSLASTPPARLKVVKAASVAVSAEKLAEIDVEVEREIEQQHLPGAVVLVARNGGIVWRQAYGSRALEPAREVMTADTIFDVASLTKIVATATSIMILVERGKLRLSDPLSNFIPEIKGEGRERITIELLLTHRAGYAPDFDLKERWSGYDEAMKRLQREPLRNPAGAKFVYSDINYIALGEVVHRVSGLTLDEFARQNIFVPLGMRDTGFRPKSDLRRRLAPTEKRRGQLSYLGDKPRDSEVDADKWLRGEVHDPTSYRMGGVAGHAGLFSTADDLAIYCQMILNGGTYRGVSILAPLTVNEMTRPRLVSESGWTRGLGWDINTSFSTNRGDLFPLGSFGHTGFTGTSLWIDPASNMFVVFLSNRVHPDGKGDVAALRGRVASIAAAAVTDLAVVARAHVELREYYEKTISELARFTVSHEQAFAANAVNSGKSDISVLNGIDVLERDNFKQLAGMRLGLVTNHTGRDRAGRSTIDVLYKAPNVKLVALFSPEHGIRGAADEKVSDSKDENTGLPIYSLYGETRRPKSQQLKDLDAVVFDIQDIGTRFYTYISTLGYVMEEAAKAQRPVFVLDRPNPIGGVDVEGPLADADKLSFTAYHRIPVRHGMTIGELAKLFNQERNIGCDLRVVKMDGWRRRMWLDETNLLWVNPSPNMRSLTEATLYSGVGLLETTNVSVGRGTDTPFEVVGAPWIEGQRLAAYLNGRRIAGVRFVPIRFTPTSSLFKGEECGGINIIITDRDSFKPVFNGFEIAVALRKLYPSQWKVDSYLRLLVNGDALERLKRGDSAADIVRSWSEGLEKFRNRRAGVLIYE
ncbi:MAG TPA: exo-beta-N-acetylmuramidase NamZ domain-containing protein [Pyrinomonadaceae bacterium]|nr:exo-beta-N-acetylmuramidase NamZ domain-containing protein [Pyrinomonadaceae bacterium]